MDKSIYNFWVKNSVDNIIPATGEQFPEGWDVLSFLRSIIDESTVVEIGCGTGRLAPAFAPHLYLGTDISEKAIKFAKAINPGYRFETVPEEHYSSGETALLYTVLLHQSDEDITKMISDLCSVYKRIVVAEILGRDWRRKGNPPVFNREFEEYIKMFDKNGKYLADLYTKPYERYKGWNKMSTDLTTMVFE